LHSHPIGLLDVRHYFRQLIALIEQARGEGFIYAEHRALLLWNEDPDMLLDDMAAYVPPSDLSRWVERPAGGSSGT
jgi:predicted Rossmann-fold nucleotide-binding protein